MVSWKRLWHDEEAQGMTEYIIIVALIAIAAIAVVTLFGDKIRELFKGSTEKLSGVEKKMEKPGK